jgi:hypothetical protein
MILNNNDDDDDGDGDGDYYYYFTYDFNLKYDLSNFRACFVTSLYLNI